MPDRKIVRGNFGRDPGEPAWDETRHSTDPRTKEYNEDDVWMAVVSIRGYREQLNGRQLDLPLVRGLEDAISSVLDGLNPAEQQEVLSRLSKLAEEEAPEPKNPTAINRIAQFISKLLSFIERNE